MTVDSTTAPFTAANRSRIVGLIVGATVNYVIAAFLGGAALMILLALWGLSEAGTLPGSADDWKVLGIIVGTLMLFGGVVGLLIAIVRLPFARRRFEQSIFEDWHVEPRRPADHPEVGNIVEALALAAGIPAPAIATVDDPAPNSFSVGTRPSRTTIGVTTGLVETLTRPELEAVIAYEITRAASLDVALCTWVLALTSAADGGIGADEASMFTGRLLGRITGRLRTRALRDMAPARDRAALALSKNPVALVAALEKLAADPRTAAPITPQNAPLWIEVPESVVGSGDLRQFLLSERIGELRALAHLGSAPEVSMAISEPPPPAPIPAPPAPAPPRHDGDAPFRPGPTSTSS